MVEDRELDEDGFPIYRPDPDELAKTQAQMNTLVDCRELANGMMASRSAPDPALLDELSRDHGLDGTKTLTEIENQDLGDAYDVADEPIVHALRYVSVAQWTPSDVQLMLNYGHGIEVGLMLAERFLQDDVMLEAEHYPGDLMETFSSVAIGGGKVGLLKRLTDRFEERTWSLFDEIAQERGLDAPAIDEHRLRLKHGVRSEPGQNPFLKVENNLQTLAGLLDDTESPEILAEARRKQLFARYRSRKSIELVPLPDLENTEYRTKIDAADTFKFRRDTEFKIVRERNGVGVRLRIFSASAYDHRQGVWFKSLDAAVATAMRDFGIVETDWDLSGLAPGPQH